MTLKRKMGIIGIGPRGGYALENLVLELANQNSLSNIEFLLFESTGNFGNGQVYDLRQATSNWINITERVLELSKREAIQSVSFNIPSFPSYHEWIDKDFEKLPEELADAYPPRAQIGKYLSQRFQSFIKPLIESKTASLLEEQVIEIALLNSDRFQIKTDTNTYENVNEILLTIGHQPTESSQQIIDWYKHASNKSKVNLFPSPYPVANFLNSKNLSSESNIGIRGFGLAMIDVVRGIAEKFGNFKTTDEKSKRCTYETDFAIKNMLVPFSLDGLPPVPKPLNAQIDHRFKPTTSQISSFEEQIGNPETQSQAESPNFLIAAFAPIAAHIFLQLPNATNPESLSQNEIETIIVQWLEDTNFEHPLITSIKQPVHKIMNDFVEMSIGEKTSSLDYCIGQVWRHCQPSIYEELSFNKCSDAVFADIIALDESTKRYSYGPPVASIQQLIALTEVDVLNLEMVNDPEIELTDGGWRFQASDKSINVQIMIDSVLDSPKIKSVNSPLVKNLLEDNLLMAVHDDLGVSTDDNGYLIPKRKGKKVPIALLGRLAKGTVIGVDAILECFGNRPRNWSNQAAKNHSKWLQKI